MVDVAQILGSTIKLNGKELTAIFLSVKSSGEEEKSVVILCKNTVNRVIL